jgi:excisionase family DNA binding protein
MLENWLTTQQAADLSGYHPNHIRRLVRSGEIQARKWGQSWQVSKQSLLAYLEAANQSGDQRRGPKE